MAAGSLEFQFPFLGLNKATDVSRRPALTSGYMNNVRPFDVLEGRARGGQRPGLDKWSDTQIGSAEQPIVAMVVIRLGT